MKASILILFVAVSLCVNAQTDTVGVYVKSGKSMYKIEPISGTKTKYNVLGSALTYGLASTKLRVAFKRSYSTNEANDSSAFYFYFPKNAIMNTSTLAYGGNMSNFVLVKMLEKGNSREVVFGKVNIYAGSQIGIDECPSKMVVEKVADNVFKASFPYGLEVGEYAFVNSGINGSGAYLPIYDFCIKH